MPLLVVVVLFYFSQAGIELCFRSFIAVFCVNSALAMTRAQVIYVASLSKFKQNLQRQSLVGFRSFM